MAAMLPMLVLMLATMLVLVLMLAMLVLAMLAPSTAPMTVPEPLVLLGVVLGAWRASRKMAPSLGLTQLEHGVRVLRLLLASFTQVEVRAH
jgi:hypothetical protein